MDQQLEDKLEEAVERCVDSWDIDTLMNFAIDEMFDYYVSTVKQFIRDQLGESNG